jgi:hypothetical protein
LVARKAGGSFVARSLSIQYAREVWRELRLVAVWPPQSQVAVGDYGYMRDHAFERLGSLRDLELSFRGRRGPTVASEVYASRGAVSCSLQGGASVPVDAAIGQAVGRFTLTFGRSNAAFLALGQTSLHELDRPADVARQVAALDAAGRWDRDWSVVTAVKVSGSGLVALSRSRNASLEVGVDGQLTLGEALAAGAEISVNSNKSIAFHAAVAGRLTPLVALRRLHVSTAAHVLRTQDAREAITEDYRSLVEVNLPD